LKLFKFSFDITTHILTHALLNLSVCCWQTKE